MKEKKVPDEIPVKKLKDWMAAKNLSLTEAAARIGVSNSLFSLWIKENSARAIPNKYMQIIASLDEIDGIAAIEKKNRLYSEIIACSKQQLCFIVSDLNIDELKHFQPGNEKGKDESLQIGGGAYYVSKAAIQNLFIPIIFSTIGQQDEDGDKIIAALKNNKIVTSLIEKNPEFGTSTCSITFMNNDKDTTHLYEKHCNDFSIECLANAIRMINADIIFLHGFRLHRYLRKINIEIQKGGVTGAEKDEEKKQYINNFMNALVHGKEGRGGKIVFDIAPSKCYENISLDQISMVIKESDVVIAELGTLLGFIKNSNLKLSNELKKDIEVDLKEPHINHSIADNQYKEYRNVIAQNFLGPKDGDVLIIRYGKGQVDYELILRRNSVNGYDILSDLSNEEKGLFTGYSKKPENEKLGSGDILTFKFLKMYFKKEENPWELKKFRENYQNLITKF